MAITDSNKLNGKGTPPVEEPLVETLPAFNEAVASSSSPHPSSRMPVASRSQEEIRPLLLRGIDDNPPEFSAWDAQYSLTSHGDVYSHDPHLNEDGEALYRFLLDHLQPPTFQLHCRGTHKEQRVRVVNSHHHHGQHSRGHSVDGGSTVLEEITLTDFDFFIDITPLLGTSERAEIYTLDHSIPAYRGSMYREVSISRTRTAQNSTSSPGFWQSLRAHISCDQPAGVRLPDDESRAFSQDLKAKTPIWRRATREERKGEKLFTKWLADSGLPPWTSMSAYDSMSGSPDAVRRPAPLPLAPQLSVREWADDYCQSTKILKDFNFRKVVYGWDFAVLRTSIEDLIRSTNYTGDVSILFETSGSNISIRPSTRLSRALSNPWLVALMWLFLVYPFIWLFRRYNRRGGGKWEVCRVAYALKRPPVSRADGSQLSEGMKEGEWFRLWQSTIAHGVRSCVQNSRPLPNRGNPAEMLDGYLL